METWTEGWLPDGTHFHIDRDPYVANGKLRIDGEVSPLAGPRITCVVRYRDGGSTLLATERGEFAAWRRIGQEHYDTWNGERLLDSNPAQAPLSASPSSP